MHRADKELIRAAERQCGRRSLPLRRWFNRRLRGGGIDREMMQAIAAAVRRLAPGGRHPAAVASHYLADVGSLSASVANGMDDWSSSFGDVPSLEQWLQSNNTGRRRGANLYRGFWRGEEGADVLTRQPPCSIRAMGDGNCFYRSVGAAMALYFPAQLQAKLAEVEYSVHYGLEGLSARYPPLADEAEVAEWNDDNRRLQEGLRHPHLDLLAWLNEVPAMDVALVRALRELVAREMDKNSPDVASLKDDLEGVEFSQLAGASERAGEAYTTVIVTTDKDVPFNYVRHIVRQLWEDALPSCYLSLGRALGVEVLIHQQLPACDDTSQDPYAVHLHHHGCHFDIWCPPGGVPRTWSCPSCTLENPTNLLACEACSATRSGASAAGSGAGPSSAASAASAADPEVVPDSDEDEPPRKKGKQRAGAGVRPASPKRQSGWVDLTGDDSE
jgi:hypothetical protein